MIHEIVQSILQRGLPERMTIQDLLPCEPEDVDCQREVSFRKGYNFGLEVYRQQLTKVLTEVFWKYNLAQALTDRNIEILKGE